MSLTALTSAEISLPAEADGARVSDRIAVLADTVDVVGLTDNHAGQPRMSPLAAVALAREQGVGTIVHVSCRDRNRLALQSQVAGAAALGAEAVLCMQGDPVPGIEHVADMKATQLIASASAWSAPHPLAVGAVVNPFAEDVDRELRLLRRKVDAGAAFVQSQMIFDCTKVAPAATLRRRSRNSRSPFPAKGLTTAPSASGCGALHADALAMSCVAVMSATCSMPGTGSPCMQRTASAPSAAAPTTCDCKASRLRSRQETWTMVPTPCSRASATAASGDIRGWPA